MYINVLLKNLQQSNIIAAWIIFSQDALYWNCKELVGGYTKLYRTNHDKIRMETTCSSAALYYKWFHLLITTQPIFFSSTQSYHHPPSVKFYAALASLSIYFWLYMQFFSASALSFSSPYKGWAGTTIKKVHNW